MKFNIYNPIIPERESSDIIKDLWSNWKLFNRDAKAIFFPIFKEFGETHLKDISGGACKLYIFLGLKSRNTGESWYSISTMADALGVKTRTIDKWLQELSDRGLIVRDRHSLTSTTYLYPYSLNIIDTKIPIKEDDSELIEKIFSVVNKNNNVAGSLYKIYHLFQWQDAKKLKSIQLIAVITKKIFKNGKPAYTAYISCDQVESEKYIVDMNAIPAVRRFKSWFNSDKEVVGIALPYNNSLLKKSDQKDALTQLSEIPKGDLNNFIEVDIIDALVFSQKYFNTEEDTNEDEENGENED